MNCATLACLPLQVSWDEIFDVTAVVPKSQITFEMTAAHVVSLKSIAPIPQSSHGFSAFFAAGAAGAGAAGAGAAGAGAAGAGAGAASAAEATAGMTSNKAEITATFFMIFIEIPLSYKFGSNVVRQPSLTRQDFPPPSRTRSRRVCCLRHLP